MIYYVFDVDGTITPPRKQMEPNLVQLFLDFCLNNNVILVSGSDSNMIHEQIPQNILNNVKLYTCSGVEGISFDLEYDISDDDLLKELDFYLNTSEFKLKTGKHINFRKGMINFSIVGRNASDAEREEYSEFDKEYKERITIINDLSKKFQKYDFLIGGEISIDISKKGINKSLVAKDIIISDPDAYIMFYGNQILDGNDYPLAKFIAENNIGTSTQITNLHIKNIL